MNTFFVLSLGDVFVLCLLAIVLLMFLKYYLTEKMAKLKHWFKERF